MSHCPGHRLEDFLTDWYGVVDDKGECGTSIRRLYTGQLILNEEQFKKLVEIYEPAREAIENCIDLYDEENRSWRDYRNSAVADCIPDDIDKASCKYLESIRGQCELTKGISQKESQTPEILSDEVLARTKFLQFNQTTYRNRTGKTKTWYWAERPFKTNAVVVAAAVFGECTLQGYDSVRLVVTEEYRIPLKDYEWGFPAGLIDANESVLNAAARELKEETGLTFVKELKPHSPLIYSSAGMTDECCYITYVQATGAPSSDQNEDDELIKVHLMLPEEVERLLSNPTKKIGAKSYFILEQFARVGRQWRSGEWFL